VAGKLEDITSLPDGIEKVDVIISEFMGYSLFFESMLDTVIIARDRWLVPGGIILPDRCTLYIFGVNDAHYKGSKIMWWRQAHGDEQWRYTLGDMGVLAKRQPYHYMVDPAKVRTCTVSQQFSSTTVTVLCLLPAVDVVVRITTYSTTLIKLISF
jgi:protein arginine N-methyltransferase 1